jgi:glycosyltransferase involved in cell wall biosynthesis
LKSKIDTVRMNSLHFVSINPDFCSPDGHYLYLERQILKAATEQGWQFHSLTNRQVLTQLPDPHPSWMHPVFSSRGIDAHNHSRAEHEAFAEELHDWCATQLEELSPSDEMILFIYAGHVFHLSAFWLLLERIRDPRLRVVFNLYAAYSNFDEDCSHWRLMRKELANLLTVGAPLVDRRRFTLTSDSATLADLAKAAWRANVPQPPFFYMTEPASPAKGASEAMAPGTVTLAYPSSVHRERGFFSFPEAVRHCQSRSDGGLSRLRFIFRTCVPESSLSREEAGVCKQLTGLGCKIVHGHLSNEAMVDFYERADIVLNPYPRKSFRDRTSGNFADAMRFGKPVISSVGTWAGRLVDSLQVGATFEDGDPVSLGKAMLKVIGNLSHYQANAIREGAKWAGENNAGALLRFVRACGDAPPPALSETELTLGRQALFRRLRQHPVTVPPLPGDFRALDELKAGNQHSNPEVRHLTNLIRHFRASPVRALRLWWNRKKNAYPESQRRELRPDNGAPSRSETLLNP